jgi:hypothetical protein
MRLTAVSPEFTPLASTSWGHHHGSGQRPGRWQYPRHPPRRPPAGDVQRLALPRGCGRLRRWWQVLGSNRRRLSRRFYRPSLLAEVHAADQHERASRRDPGLPTSAMRPWAPGPEGAECTDGHGRRGWERCADRPEERSADRSARRMAADLAFQAAGSLLSPSSPPGPGPGSMVLSASVMRWLAATIPDAWWSRPRKSLPWWRRSSSAVTTSQGSWCSRGGGWWSARCAG